MPHKGRGLGQVTQLCCEYRPGPDRPSVRSWTKEVVDQVMEPSCCSATTAGDGLGRPIQSWLEERECLGQGWEGHLCELKTAQFARTAKGVDVR